jgi:MGT family glycosyltransferase
MPWVNSSEPPFIRQFMPPEQEWAYAEENIFFGESYQSDLHPVIEEISPDVVMVDALLRYAILEGLRSGLPLVVLCHTLYGGTVEYPETSSLYYPALVEAAADQGVPGFASRKDMLDLTDLVLVFTYAEFDVLSGAEAGENVLHVGPLRTRGSGASDWVRRFPDRPLVVIGLSTSDQNQAALLQRLCDACGTLDVEALVTRGPSLATEQLSTADNVEAVEFINHDEVLPQADLLITHAGLGTAMAGIAYGVPMLCTPLGRDQPFNAERVEALGVGVVAESESSTDELRQAIADLLNDPDIRNRAQDLSRNLQTHPGPAIDTNIQRP